jgi:hypothetical protein
MMDLVIKKRLVNNSLTMVANLTRRLRHDETGTIGTKT